MIHPDQSAKALALLSTLTESESDAVRLMASGLSDEESGKLLAISREGVRNRIRRAVHKTEAKSRTCLAVIAALAGWVTL